MRCRYTWNVDLIVIASAQHDILDMLKKMSPRRRFKCINRHLILWSSLKSNRISIYDPAISNFAARDSLLNSNKSYRVHRSRTSSIPMVLPANQEVAATSVSFIFFVLYLTTLFHCLRWLVFADEGWKIARKLIGRCWQLHWLSASLAHYPGRSN